MTRRYGRGRRRRKEARREERRGRRKAERRELNDGVRERLQLSLDREEVLELLRNSLDVFAIAIGRRVAVGLLEDEVEQLCGPRHDWDQAGRTATRYGRQQGYICVGGQKTRIQRPRVRSTTNHGGEVPLERYGQLQQPEALPQAFLRRLVRGVSTRDYEGVIDSTAAACGVKKSSVSRGFVRASAESLKAWTGRSLTGTRYVAVFIDGVEYAGETLVVALGLTTDGHKHVLGLRQGATENAPVVTSLLEELQTRGLDTSRPTLFVLDGAKALVAGVKRVFGRQAVIQRCQIHKRRNVQAHLPQRHHAELNRRLSEAYSQTSYAQAKSLLHDAVLWLKRLSPDAAASLEEGLEETLTVIRLGVPELLRRTLSNTNVIESALSVTRTVTARVKRWRDGDMRRRWCSAGLVRAETKFRRVKGYRQLPQLIATLDTQLDAKSKAG
jgi:transposase-like protein